MNYDNELNYDNQQKNRDKFLATFSYGVYFAFTLGVKLTLKAHGYEIDDYNAIMPVLKKMQAIVNHQRNSTIAAHDDLNIEEFLALRELEHALCKTFLDETKNVNL